MKTPDALDDAIEDATSNMDARDAQSDIAEANRVCQQWFKHGEYLTVEIDTKKQTCVVVRS
jgi:hypothetical protein